MIDRLDVKLGKLPPRHDARTLMLTRRYFDSLVLPAPPLTTSWRNAVSVPWGTMLNAGAGAIGDCGVAGYAHGIMGWSSNVGTALVVSDADVETAYSAISGFQPGNPTTDVGVDLLSAATYFRNVGLAGNKLEAFAAVNFADEEWVKIAIDLFGGVYTGLALPLSAQVQDVWDVTGLGIFGKSRPGSWGGHCTWAIDYNSTGPIMVTWGEVIQATWRFWLKYCDEAYAFVSKLFINATTGKSPLGFDLPTMLTDVTQVTA